MKLPLLATFAACLLLSGCGLFSSADAEFVRNTRANYELWEPVLRDNLDGKPRKFTAEEAKLGHAALDTWRTVIEGASE